MTEIESGDNGPTLILVCILSALGIAAMLFAWFIVACALAGWRAIRRWI